MRISFNLGKKAVDALTDSTPAGQMEKARLAAEAVPGVRSAYDVRMRHAGAQQFIDLKIGTQPNMALGAVHELTESVERALKTVFADADILVHAEPDGAERPGIAETAFRLAQLKGINIHDLQVHRLDRGLQMDMHLEWPYATTLGQAHQAATELEQKLRALYPELSVVHSHLETCFDAVHSGRTDVTAAHGGKAAEIARHAALVPGVHAVEQVIIFEKEGRWHVSLTCRVKGDMPLRHAHELATAVEVGIIALSKRICSVSVHTEPLA
jgi:divalent metal cation (Fe/Co/Zn/Cd) transporter